MLADNGGGGQSQKYIQQSVSCMAAALRPAKTLSVQAFDWLAPATLTALALSAHHNHVNQLLVPPSNIQSAASHRCPHMPVTEKCTLYKTMSWPTT
jgi:hypothetical protein